MNGILIIDKPKDYTSFDIIAVVRGCVRERKAGHTGTLDPMATGVLPVLLGSATKAQSLLPDTDKEYIAWFRLGITTDTLDITGTVKTRCESHVSREEILDLLPQFRGDIMQLPPMYSAVFKNGVRLYELARQGIETQREPRLVHVGKLELTDFDPEEQCGSLMVSCSKGTYIRSICDDLGRLLGCGCVMTSLRRTRACGYDISQAIPLNRIRELAQQGPGAFEELILPVDSVFSELPSVSISEKQVFRFKNGAPLSLSRIKSLKNPEDRQLFRVYSNDGLFLAIGQINLEKEELEVKKQF